MVNDFNKHLGEMLKKRRLALGLTQTKVAKAINVTFQQIQKYEKGINGVSSVRLLQLASYLKVPINYFFDDYSAYLNNLDKTAENYMSVNYNFLVKIFSELTQEQKNKFNKLTVSEINFINKKPKWIAIDLNENGLIDNNEEKIFKKIFKFGDGEKKIFTVSKFETFLKNFKKRVGSPTVTKTVCVFF